MKNIIVITLVLSVLSAGVIGLMLLFGFIDADRVGGTMLKTIGGFVILGVCAALISVLMPARKGSDN